MSFTLNFLMLAFMPAFGRFLFTIIDGEEEPAVDVS